MKYALIAMVLVSFSFSALCATTMTTEERIKQDYDLFIRALEKKSAEIKATDAKAENALVQAGSAKLAAGTALEREAKLRREFEEYKASHGAATPPVRPEPSAPTPPVVPPVLPKRSPGDIETVSFNERYYYDGKGERQPFKVGIVGVTDTGAYHQLQEVTVKGYRWEWIDGPKGVEGERLKVIRIVSPDEAQEALKREAQRKSTSQNNATDTGWTSSYPSQPATAQTASFTSSYASAEPAYAHAHAAPAFVPAAAIAPVITEQYHVCPVCGNHFPIGTGVDLCCCAHCAQVLAARCASEHFACQPEQNGYNGYNGYNQGRRGNSEINPLGMILGQVLRHQQLPPPRLAPPPVRRIAPPPPRLPPPPPPKRPYGYVTA